MRKMKMKRKEVSWQRKLILVDKVNIKYGFLYVLKGVPRQSQSIQLAGEGSSSGRKWEACSLHQSRRVLCNLYCSFEKAEEEISFFDRLKCLEDGQKLAHFVCYFICLNRYKQYWMASFTCSKISKVQNFYFRLPTYAIFKLLLSSSRKVSNETKGLPTILIYFIQNRPATSFQNLRPLSHSHIT